MFLLSKDILQKPAYLEDEVVIHPIKPQNLIKNFYYFTAGDTLKLISPEEEIIDLEKEQKVTIPGNGFGLIKSSEHFRLKSSVFAIFGNITDLIKRGLSIINSPSIDPGFSGHLTLGIKNLTDKQVDISYGEKIGKILFFNITDTALDFRDLKDEEEMRMKLNQREKGEEFK